MTTCAVHLVVPVKDPGMAKQRLGEVLDAGLRESLFRAMVADTFRAIGRAQRLDSVSVVTRDPDVVSQARGYGFNIIDEPGNLGHTGAVDRGFAALCASGAPAAMTLPADMPCVTGEDIDTLVARFASLQSSTGCVLVPAADFAGTNAAILAPPDLFQFRFGSDSFYPHVDAAKRAGVNPMVVENDNIALDVDTPDDLGRLSGRQCGEQTAVWLQAHPEIFGN